MPLPGCLKSVGAASAVFTVAIVLLLTGCFAVSTLAVDDVSTQPPASRSPTVPETAEITPLTLTMTPVPSVPECHGGTILFHSSSAPDQLVYAICPDGSMLSAVEPSSGWYSNTGLSPQGDVDASVSGYQLILQDLSGQQIKVLVDYTPISVHNLTWSPDGEYLVFAGIMYTNGKPYFRAEAVHVATETLSVHFIPGDDSEGLPIDEGYQWIGWSPASSQLMLYSGMLPLRIVDVSCDNSTHLCTAQKLRDISDHWSTKTPYYGWSPDGTKIAYACYHAYVDANEALWVSDYLDIIDVATGTNIAEFKEEDLGIRDINSVGWSPDGTQVVFEALSDGSNEGDVFILSLKDGELRNLTEAIPGNHTAPVWVP